MVRRLVVSALLLAAAGSFAGAECFYPKEGGAPEPIMCPESAHYPDKLPTPPAGLVWRALGDHKYAPELLFRMKDGKIVQDAPGADPYSALAIEVKPDGAVVKLGFQAPDAAPAAPQQPPAPGRSAAELLNDASEALHAGNASGAARLASESLELEKSPQGYFIRASADNMLSNFEAALQDAQDGLKLAPDDPMLLQAKTAAQASVAKRETAPPPLAGPDHSKDVDTTGWVVVPKKDEPAGTTSRNWTPFLVVFAILMAVAGAGGGFWYATRLAPQLRVSAYATTRLTEPGEKAAAPTETPTAPATAPAAAGKPGLLKGRFELRGKIGVGGMGIVYDGFDHSLGRRVAIKQMRSELKEFPEERQAFLGEARIISHLSHPYIVAFHDVVEEGGEVYLVFDFVDGKPLSQILWEKKKLSLKECQQIYTYVCEAIACAHENHVLHRDLKPANIMVDKQGYAKVMDFGIAREAKETITRLTHADTAGTPWYMAPEQHLGKCAKASDIYALGVCLYETMTGKLPFPGPDFLAQKERMKYTPPQFLAPELPKEAELLFAATLNPDPLKRVATASELLESLKSLKG